MSDSMNAPCPVCGNLTFVSIEDEGDICEVCFWELEAGEDERDDITKPTYGPNGDLSVAKAKENYLKYGAVEEQFITFVRPPFESEVPKS